MLFVGSSSIVRWETLGQDMAGLPAPVLNRGFGGSQFEDLLRYLDRIVLPYRPRAIVVYEGDNDVAAGLTADRVAADFRRFVAAVRRALPRTHICFVSIKPSLARWSLWPEMQRANRAIAAYTRSEARLCYLDVATPMLRDDGAVREDLFVADGLHLNAQGYRIWVDVVRPRLLSMLAPEPGRLSSESLPAGS